MRVFELTSGIRIPISAEEQEILARIMLDQKVTHKSLSEREQEVARLMVSRGLIIQKQDKKQRLCYVARQEDIWRI
jgi:hypothetical protein